MIHLLATMEFTTSHRSGSIQPGISLLGFAATVLTLAVFFLSIP